MRVSWLLLVSNSCNSFLLSLFRFTSLKSSPHSQGYSVIEKIIIMIILVIIEIAFIETIILEFENTLYLFSISL